MLKLFPNLWWWGLNQANKHQLSSLSHLLGEGLMGILKMYSLRSGQGWYTLIFLAHGSLEQEDQEFEDSLG